MKEILKSASKIVFVLMALATVVGFFLGRLSETNFMLLAGSAFTFYFSNKGEVKPAPNGDHIPYAGK